MARKRTLAQTLLCAGILHLFMYPGYEHVGTDLRPYACSHVHLRKTKWEHWQARMRAHMYSQMCVLTHLRFNTLRLHSRLDMCAHTGAPSMTVVHIVTCAGLTVLY